MSVQQFCLRWNNHQPNFISVFTNLLHNEVLVDVTLGTEGKQLQAHKVVLAACSSYFQSLFTTNPCQHPIVILKDVKYSDLKIIVDFMYYGEVNVSQEQLPAILKTAEMLKIKGLAEMPERNVVMKSQGSSSDRSDNVMSDPGWNTDTSHRSPSPSSPSVCRKRLRQNSAESGSIEQAQEDIPGDVSMVPTLIIKPEPAGYSDSGMGGTKNENFLHRNNVKDPNTDTEPRESSVQSVEDDNYNVSISRESSIEALDPSNIDTGPGSGTTDQPSNSSQGLHWMFREHGIPLFALSSCQADLPLQSSSPFCVPESSSTIRQFSSQQKYNSSCAVTSSIPSSQNSLNSYFSSYNQIQNLNSPLRRKRSSNPQAEENFVCALDAVRYGGIGFCKAARMYGVNNRTLWLEYKRRGYPVLRPSVKSRIALAQANANARSQICATSSASNNLEGDFISKTSDIEYKYHPSQIQLQTDNIQSGNEEVIEPQDNIPDLNFNPL